jgi:hypothetical protein
MSVNAQLVTIFTALVLTAAVARVALGAIPMAGTASVYAAVKLGPHPDGWGLRVELAAQ